MKMFAITLVRRAEVTKTLVVEAHDNAYTGDVKHAVQTQLDITAHLGQMALPKPSDYVGNACRVSLPGPADLILGEDGILVEACLQGGRPAGKRDSALLSDTDAAEPITPEWLLSIGFEQNRPCHVHGTPNCNWWHEQYALEIWQFNDTTEWLWVEYDRVPMTCRRDLRLLMEWRKTKERPPA